MPVAVTGERDDRRKLMRFRGSQPPPAADVAANVRWLRDRELIKDLYARYAYVRRDLALSGNRYVEIDGDRGFVETWVVGYYREAAASPIDSLTLALRCKDDVVRAGQDWNIHRREVVEGWHTGPFPRPFIGPSPFPRGT